MNEKQNKQTSFDILFNEDEYKELLAKASKDNVKVVHVRGTGFEKEYNKYGGATAALGRNLSRGATGEMSVALCASTDIFVKRLGSYIALKKFYAGKRIPIYVNNSTPTKVAKEMLQTMFIATS